MYSKDLEQSNKKKLNEVMKYLKKELTPDEMEWILSKERKDLYTKAGDWIIDLGEKNKMPKRHAKRI